MELRAVLAEATDAVARLDTRALSELEQRARALQAMIAGGAGMCVSAEIAARHRVFAAVVRATGENLAILEGARSGESRWAR